MVTIDKNIIEHKFISLSVPSIRGNEWNYVKECLDTEWVSSAGKYVDMFEQKICELTGSKYAVATVNGTSALHISLILAGVKPDEEVIVPSITFIAPVNAVRYVNAEPVFMDCDEFYNINIEKTIGFIIQETIFRDGSTFNKTSDRKITAIIPVHVFGSAVDLEPLLEICKSRNIKIIEDATESLGTYYTEGPLKNKHAGTIGDIGCLSFNGNKIITTGGGGMILTDNSEIAEKAKYLTTQAKDDGVRYIHDEIGYNYRLSNIQSALGVAQLEQLQRYIDIKKKNYLRYKNSIDNIKGLHLDDVPPYAESNYWFYSIQIDKDVYGRDKEELMQFLSAHNIQSRTLWYPNHLQKPYRNCQTYKIEKAMELHEKSLNLPCSVGLSDNDVDYIVEVLRK
jgi:perosamine synthetase